MAKTANSSRGIRCDTIWRTPIGRLVLLINNKTHMLAIKLHKKPKPFLAKGSYLIPVLSWEKAHRDVRNWIAMLNHHNRFRPNNKILYVTLVRITDDFPCTLNDDWIEHDENYVPWKQVPADMKKEQVRWIEGSKWHHAATGSFPQLILGATIPARCILWTKNARLLFRGDLRRKGKEPRKNICRIVAACL